MSLSITGVTGKRNQILKRREIAMSIINNLDLSKAHLYASLSGSADTPAETRVSADHVALAEGGISHHNLWQSVAASAVSFDRNQIANEGDADKLQEADALVADAYGLVGGRNASFIDQFRARVEMAEASALRQGVAKDLEARYPDDGLGVGGSLYGEQIRQADAEEQAGFRLVQSPNLADVSAGATDLWEGSGLFSSIETSLRG